MSDERASLLGNQGHSTEQQHVERDGDPVVESLRTDGMEAGACSDSDAPKISLIAAFSAIGLGVFLGGLDTTIVISTYASIGSEMNQLHNTSWIATSYMLSLTCFQPFYGKLSDIFGRKPCMLFAYSVFGLGCLLCGLAPSMGHLVAARALAGVGGGGMQTVGVIIMSDLIPLRERGTWQGYASIIYATGQSIGAPLGGLLADTIGWRWAFILQVPITLLALLIATISLRIPEREPEQFLTKLKRIDFLGALLVILATSALCTALNRGSTVAWLDPTILTSLGASVALYILLAYVEVRVAVEPFLPKHIFTKAGLLPAFLVNFFTLAASTCIAFNIALYIQAVRGLAARTAGMWLLPNVVGGVTGSLLSGFAIRQTGKYYALGLGAYTLASLSILGVGLTTGWWVELLPAMAVCLFTMTLGYGSGMTTTLVGLVANAGPADQAVATAVGYQFRFLGSIVGVSGSSAIVQSVLRRELYKELPEGDIDEIVRRVRESLDYINTLPPTTRAIVRDAYRFAVQHAWVFSLVSCAAIVLSAVFIKERPLPSRKPTVAGPG